MNGCCSSKPGPTNFPPCATRLLNSTATKFPSASSSKSKTEVFPICNGWTRQRNSRDDSRPGRQLLSSALRRIPASQVQTPIIQRKRRVIRPSRFRQSGHELRPKMLIGNALQVLTENDMTHKFRVMLRVIKYGRRRFKTGHNLDKAGALERAGCSFCVRIKPRFTKIREECGELWRAGQRQGSLSQRRYIWPPATLRLQPPSRTQSSP